MKEKNTAKRLFSVLWIYFLCAALTAILIPLPQKESSGELWRQHEARLDTPAAQERKRFHTERGKRSKASKKPDCQQKTGSFSQT